MPLEFSDSATLPKPLNVAAGGAYIRTMYAAMGPTVVRAVLLNYLCRSEAVVDFDESLTADAREVYKASFQDAVDEIGEASALYFPAFAQGDVTKAQAIKPTTAKYPALPAASRIPSKLLDKSIGEIADKSFIIQQNYEGYISGSFGGIEATACGNSFVRLWQKCRCRSAFGRNDTSGPRCLF